MVWTPLACSSVCPQTSTPTVLGVSRHRSAHSLKQSRRANRTMTEIGAMDPLVGEGLSAHFPKPASRISSMTAETMEAMGRLVGQLLSVHYHRQASGIKAMAETGVTPHSVSQGPRAHSLKGTSRTSRTMAEIGVTQHSVCQGSSALSHRTDQPARRMMAEITPKGHSTNQRLGTLSMPPSLARRTMVVARA
jgi:hypothetical protein